MIRSEDTNIDPHDDTKTIPIWNTEEDRTRFLLHPFLHPIKKKDYAVMMSKKTPVASTVLPLSLARRVFESLANIIFASSSTNMVLSTYLTTSRFSELLSTCTEAQRNTILKWNNKKGATLGATLKTKNMCNNYYAQKILLIYLYQYHTSFDPHVALPWFIRRHGTNEYHVTTRGGAFFELWVTHIFRFHETDKQMTFYFTRYDTPSDHQKAVYEKKEKEIKTRLGIE